MDRERRPSVVWTVALAVVLVALPGMGLLASSGGPSPQGSSVPVGTSFTPNPPPAYPWVAFSTSGIRPTSCAGGGSVFPYCVSISVYGDSLLFFEYVQPNPGTTSVQFGVHYDSGAYGFDKSLSVVSLGYNATAGTSSFVYRLYYDPNYFGSWVAFDVPLAALDGVPQMSAEVTPGSPSWTLSATTPIPSTSSDLAIFLPSVFWLPFYDNDCPSITAVFSSVLAAASGGGGCTYTTTYPNEVETAVVTQNLTAATPATLTASLSVGTNFTLSSYNSEGWVFLVQRSLPTALTDPTVSLTMSGVGTTSFSASWVYTSEPYFAFSHYLIGRTGADIFDYDLPSGYLYQTLNVTTSTSVTYYGLTPSVCYYFLALPVATLTWFGLDLIVTGSNSTSGPNVGHSCTVPFAPTATGGSMGGAVYLSMALSFLPDVFVPYAGVSWATQYIAAEEVRYGATTGGCSSVAYTVDGYLGGSYSPALSAKVIGGSLAPSQSWALSVNITNAVVAGDTYCFESRAYNGNSVAGAWSSPISVTVANVTTPPVNVTPPIMPSVGLNTTVPSHNVSNPPNGLTTLVVLQLPVYQASGGLYTTSVAWTNRGTDSFSGEFVLEAWWLTSTSHMNVSANGRALTSLNEFNVGDGQVYVFPGSSSIDPNGTARFTLTFVYTPPSPLSNGAVFNGVFYSLGELYDIVAFLVIVVLSYLSVVMRRVGAASVIATVLIFLTVGVELFG